MHRKAGRSPALRPPRKGRSTPFRLRRPELRLTHVRLGRVPRARQVVPLSAGVSAQSRVLPGPLLPEKPKASFTRMRMVTSSSSEALTAPRARCGACRSLRCHGQTQACRADLVRPAPRPSPLHGLQAARGFPPHRGSRGLTLKARGCHGRFCSSAEVPV